MKRGKNTIMKYDSENFIHGYKTRKINLKTQVMYKIYSNIPKITINSNNAPPGIQFLSLIITLKFFYLEHTLYKNVTFFIFAYFYHFVMISVDKKTLTNKTFTK